ncbi:MAG: TMEM165/GDT1 family protein [Clostridium fessum]
MKSAFVVWIGCSLGLFAADILGMLVGYLLKSKTPDGLLNTLAFVIFSIFGAFTLHQGLNMMNARVLSDSGMAGMDCCGCYFLTALCRAGSI